MSGEIKVKTELQELQEVQNPIWADLHKKFFEHLDAENKQGQKRNFKSAFKLFMLSTGLTMDSPVGSELTEEFETKLEIFVALQIKRGNAETTYRPRVSKIRALKEFVDENFASQFLQQALPKAFGQRLRYLISTLGWTIKSLWRDLPRGLITYETLRNWCVEKLLPSANLLHVIETIESHLQVPAGTLRPPRYINAGHDLQIGVSDSGNKARAAQSKPYYFWSEPLEREFRGLFLYKTEAILPEGIERSDEGQWTNSEGAGVPSADMVKRVLKSFVGFCALPADSPDPYLRGAGIEHGALSIALLADKGLVERYLHFKKLRSGLRVRRLETNGSGRSLTEKICADGLWSYYDVGGKYNNGSLLFLSNASSLLRPGTGYLYQHPELAEKLGSRMIATTWQQQCINTRTRVEVLRRDLSRMKKKGDQKNFDFGREPQEIIKWLLDLPRPLLVLHQMIKDMLDDLLPDSTLLEKRARQFRNILLIALLTSNPLRIRMFSIMEFGKHLIRDGDGSWWLQFKQGAFKNRRALKSDYKVRIAQELWPLLDQYQKEFHPALIGPTQSHFVFVSAGRGIHRKQRGEPMTQARLSDIVRNMTELYIQGAIGFRPHAFRHIIATDIIKLYPKFGFFLASRALHDKLETVEQDYIHLKTSEFFEPVNTHFSETWSKVFGS